MYSGERDGESVFLLDSVEFLKTSSVSCLFMTKTEGQEKQRLREEA